MAATKKENKSAEYDLLRCATYNNGGKNACSSHTIRFDALYAIVLEDICHYTALAAEDEQALTERLFQALLHEEQDEVKSRARKLSALRQKLEMVRQKIEKLYDEKFEKGMDEEIFKTMSARYESEKNSLEAEITVSEAEASKTRSKEDSIRFWTAAVKQAITIDGLTRDVLGTLVDHIVVHEREKVDGETRQRVEIYYKFVGKLSDVPEKLDAAG